MTKTSVARHPDPLELFRHFLEERGLRLTRDRRTIIEAVFATHSHFTMDDLFVHMRSSGVRLSKTTLYRNLPLLIESGLIRRVPNETANGIFEHILGHPHHDHLICLHCGREIEFMSKALEEAQEAICRKFGFEPVRHRLGIWGYCGPCRRTRRGRRAGRKCRGAGASRTSLTSLTSPTSAGTFTGTGKRLG